MPGSSEPQLPGREGDRWGVVHIVLALMLAVLDRKPVSQLAPCASETRSTWVSEGLSVLCRDALGDLEFTRKLQLCPGKLYAAQRAPSPHSPD